MRAMQGYNAYVNSWDNMDASFCPVFSDPEDSRYVRVLAANVAKSFTVPPLANKVFFQILPLGTVYWVDESKPAVIPSGDVTDGTAAEMCPAGRAVTPGQTLSVIAGVTATIQAIFYR